MKKLLLLLFLLPVFSVQSANAQGWQWARSAGHGDFLSFIAEGTDVHGNLYTIGNFQSDSLIFGTDTLFARGVYANASTYLVKYDSLGNVLWARGTDSFGGCVVTSLAIDTAGNSYLTGYSANNQLIFGNDTLINHCAPYESMVFVKYDANGNVVWVRGNPAGSPDTSVVIANSVTTDIAGNLYIAGSFQSKQLVFGADTLRNLNDTDYDVFVAKYDVSGNPLWARQSTNYPISNTTNIIRTDAIGNIYTEGFIQANTITFGTTTLANSAMSCYFVKYDALGNLQWVRCFYDTTGCVVASLATDTTGNILISGVFYGTMAIGTDTFVSVTASGIPGSDYCPNMFLLKYDALGNLLWTKKSSGQSGGGNISIDHANNIYVPVNVGFTVVGIINDTMILDSNTYISPSGGENFLMKYNSNGNLLGAIDAGRTGEIVVDNYDRYFYAAGTFNYTMPLLVFGNDSLYCDTYNPDLFISRYNIGCVAFLPSITTSISQVTCYGSNNGSISITVNKGQSSYQYLWSNGISDSSIKNLVVGTYSVNMTDPSTQCVVKYTFDITQPDSLSVLARIIKDHCNLGLGSVDLVVTGGTPSYSYLWSNNTTDHAITGLTAGVYSVAVTDSNSCTKNILVNINEDTCISIVIHDVLTPNGDGINDTWDIEGIQQYSANTVQVYDKWGDIVYNKTNYNNDWGGMGKSGLLPDGTYYYLVKLNAANLQGGKNVWTGSILIKR